MAEVQFKITNAGLEQIIKAEEQGLKVKVTHFTLGDAYGYEPSVNDTSLHGNMLYRGEPKSFKYVDPNTRLVVCALPATVGPFDYGEIGLWVEGGVLFALCAFDKPVPKYSSIENEVSSSATFNCLLTLDQSMSSVTLDYEENPQAVNEIEVLSTWAEVARPSELQLSPMVQGLIVQQASPDGRQTWLTRDVVGDTWSVNSTYQMIASRVPMQVMTTTTVEVLNDGSVMDSSLIVGDTGYYLLQINGGYFRTATATIAGSNIRFTFVDPVPVSASNNLFIFQPQKVLLFITADQIRGQIPYSQISGIPEPEVIESGIGTVSFMPVKKIPKDYLWANGATVNRSAYPKLFAAIGTAFGAGDGATTFKLPDLRGYFPRFLDDGRGVDSEPRRAVGSVQSDTMRNITASGLGVNGPTLDWAGGLKGAFYKVKSYSGKGNGSYGAFDVGFDASRVVPTASEVRVKNMAFLPLIKYQ